MGKDPSAAKTAARRAPSVKELCTKFVEDYSTPKNRTRTVESNQGYVDRHIVPNLGTVKVRDTRGCFRLDHADEKDARNNPCRHIPEIPGV
jgi:hypothetical protein